MAVQLERERPVSPDLRPVGIFPLEFVDPRYAYEDNIFNDGAVRVDSVYDYATKRYIATKTPQNLDLFQAKRQHLPSEEYKYLSVLHDSPYILRTHGITRAFDEEGRLVSSMLMEELFGQSLNDWIETHHHSTYFSKALSFIHQFGSAIRDCHDHGIVIGDVSPANVCITDNGRLKLFDFGLATVVNGDESIIGPKIGSSDFSPPERYEGIYGKRGDVYSSTMIILMLLSNQYYADSAVKYTLLLQQISPTDHHPVLDFFSFSDYLDSTDKIKLITALSKGVSISPSPRPTMSELLNEIESVLAPLAG